MTCMDKCNRCKRDYPHVIPDIFADSPTLERIRGNGLCPDCESIAAREHEEEELHADLEQERRKRIETMSDRYRESNLTYYQIDFDPGRPDANRALMSWMLRNLDRCVWVHGRTGVGKTRVIQAAAVEAVRDRSVRFWPMFDLTSRLTETSKKPEAQLLDIYRADLLILDDLGVANMTAARLTALTAIIDRRYIGWDQARQIQKSEAPEFNLYLLARKRFFGGQLWVTSQDAPEDIVRKLSVIDAADATALVRRLADMCVVHEAEAAG